MSFNVGQSVRVPGGRIGHVLTIIHSKKSKGRPECVVYFPLTKTGDVFAFDVLEQADEVDFSAQNANVPVATDAGKQPETVDAQ